MYLPIPRTTMYGDRSDNELAESDGRLWNFGLRMVLDHGISIWFDIRKDG